jgi:hydroxymethylpyrimidine pyrophosphatase-like HAD family hydrolase
LGFERDHVLVAGNSGNDAKLFEHDFHGIIVSNAHEELKRYADQPRIYLSPHARADGVRDGLRYWIGELTDQS